MTRAAPNGPRTRPQYEAQPRREYACPCTNASTEPDEPAGSVTKNVNSRLDDQLAGESDCHGVSLTGDVRSTGSPGLDATVLKRMGENTLGVTVSRGRAGEGEGGIVGGGGTKGGAKGGGDSGNGGGDGDGASGGGARGGTRGGGKGGGENGGGGGSGGASPGSPGGECGGGSDGGGNISSGDAGGGGNRGEDGTGSGDDGGG
eukprot:scaffold99475_cov72-Phaeocystis_antarctica.AAC.5